MILDKLLEEWLQVSGPWEYALERDGEGEAAANLANLRKRTRALAAEQPENSQQVGMSRTPETDAIDATADQNYGTDMYRDMLGHARRLEREVAYWKQEFYRVEKMVESEQDRVEELERQLAAAKEAIEDAPHAEYCGAPSSSGAEVYECRCWKAEALSKLGVDREGKL